MAGELSRRGVLGAALGAIVARFVPALPAISAVPAVAAPANLLLPAWIVGTPGEPDHEVVRALTREAAIAFRCDGCDGDDDGLVNQPGCDCYSCSEQGGYEATRVAEWDDKPVVTDGDWMAAGFETRCDRCDYEVSYDLGGRVVQGKPVCDECLTLADWRLVDSERAAEMEAEALADAAADAAQVPAPSLKSEGR